MVVRNIFFAESAHCVLCIPREKYLRVCCFLGGRERGSCTLDCATCHEGGAEVEQDSGFIPHLCMIIRVTAMAVYV